MSLSILLAISIVSVYAQEYDSEDPQSPICGDSTSGDSKFEPVLTDPLFEVERYVSGLNWPTTMAFVGNDILVLQKNNGLVCHVKDGILQEKPVLDVEVNPRHESGLLGITTKGQSEVYLFFTESERDGGDVIGSHIYKYFWNGEELVDGVLIRKNLFINIGDDHMGGPMVTHFDGNVYAIIGDSKQEEKNQNFMSGLEDDSSSIISVEREEEHYAVGIRSSFGLAVDPLTGNIWDTENGHDFNDEINLVLPHFNSGWKKIMGPGSEEDIENISYDGYHYSDPEFTWEVPVSPTGITFVESELFRDFNNSILVGDFNNGNLYKFNLNEERTGFVFDDPSLRDLVVNRGESMQEIIFGSGFAGITDLEVGPDGLIYIVSIGDGTVHRIIPSEQDLDETSQSNCSSKPGPRVNLSGCNLSGLTLQNTDLSFANLANTNLSGAGLSDNILSHSNLAGADLRGANLSNANLANAILTDAKLQGADLSGAEMKFAVFDGANLKDAKMNSANLKNTNFNNANLMNVDLSEANLEYATLKNTNLKGANLGLTNLNRAYFYNANLQETYLVNSTILRTNFTNSDLSSSNLQGIYPYTTDFTDVIFSEETKTDSCLDIDLFSRALNRMLREIRQIDSEILEPLESLIVQICKP